jgi:NADH-quinone oxidoreductase subunit K
MSLLNYIYLAVILFVIGGAAVLTRRNAIIVFMGASSSCSTPRTSPS